MSKTKPNQSSTPQHVAIIMDGNRRWARQHQLEIIKGHAYVAEKVIETLVDRCLERGVKYLTLWAFSTENWHRDPAEVEGLMQLFRHSFTKSAEPLHAKGVRLSMIGDLSGFPKDIQDNVQHWLDTSAKNQNMTVTFALNYGGRDELVRAINKAGAKGSPVTAESIEAHLDTVGMPDPDLIIRPGGEQRLSGFLPWQGVYAELYFTDVLMPDFGPDELDIALAEFAKRQRRFGK